MLYNTQVISILAYTSVAVSVSRQCHSVVCSEVCGLYAAFGGDRVEELSQVLIDHDFNYLGKEYLTSGITG